MKLNPLVGMILLAIATITVCFSPAPLSWAATSASNQSNQDINRSALLIAPKPNTQIKLYGQPDTRKGSVGQALGGDRVTLLRQVSSNEGTVWNYVALNDSSKIEGWVEDAFLSFQTAQARTPQSQNSGGEKPWSKFLKPLQNLNSGAEKPWSKFLKPQQKSGNSQTQTQTYSSSQSKKFNDQGGAYSQKQQQQ